MQKATITTFLISSVLFLASCSPYGEKIEMNSKSEVYYKEGATKAEAQKLGDFLLRNNYFDDQSEKSVQVLKAKDTAVVKFVVNEEKLKGNSEAELAFQYMHMLLRDSVFAGKPTRLIIANDDFDDIRTVKELSKEQLSGGAQTEQPAPAKTEP